MHQPRFPLKSLPSPLDLPTATGGPPKPTLHLSPPSPSTSCSQFSLLLLCLGLPGLRHQYCPSVFHVAGIVMLPQLLWPNLTKSCFLCFRTSHVFSDSFLSVVQACVGCGFGLLRSPAISSYLGAFHVTQPSKPAFSSVKWR